MPVHPFEKIYFCRFNSVSVQLSSTLLNCSLSNDNFGDVYISVCPVRLDYRMLDSNKNIIKSSFKRSRDIQKKEGGPDSCFG